MKSQLSLIVAIMMLVPAGAQAQSGQAGAAAQAQAKTPKARIDAAMEAAARADVPVSLLQSKVAEGEAKNVPQERIAAAVEARAHALIDAARTLEGANLEAGSAGELSITADAIQAGVSKNVLIKTYRNAPDERRIIAVAVVTDLVRLGTQSEQAFLRVNGALNSSVALANLQAEVASQLRLGGLTTTLDASGILRIK